MLPAHDEELDLTPVKYERVGYCPSDRYCDTIVELFTKVIPGDGVLPSRWAYKNHNYFTNKHGNLGTVLWAKTASYHLLMINGHHICRIWTDVERRCFIDIASHLDDGKAVPIPEKNVRKCKPFTKRFTVVTDTTVSTLTKRIKTQYGI